MPYATSLYSLYVTRTGIHHIEEMPQDAAMPPAMMPPLRFFTLRCCYAAFRYHALRLSIFAAADVCRRFRDVTSCCHAAIRQLISRCCYAAAHYCFRFRRSPAAAFDFTLPP